MNGKDKVQVAINPGVAFVGVTMEKLDQGDLCELILRTDGTFEVRKHKKTFSEYILDETKMQQCNPGDPLEFNCDGTIRK